MSTFIELDWIKEARSNIGLHEIKDNEKLKKWLSDLKVSWLGNNPAWCGVFIAHCLKTANVSYPKLFWQAGDYRNYGTLLNTPCYGCVAIKKRVGGNHVCFVIGKNENGKIACIGGNQNDRVSIAYYNVGDFDQYRWYGKTALPMENRYRLPLVKVGENILRED